MNLPATTLSGLQEDAITELLNIGIGQAAGALSEIMGEEVSLTIPLMEFLPNTGAAQGVSTEPSDIVAGIQQRFEGTFQGAALLLFQESDCMQLVRALLHDTVPLAELSELEEEALAEIGNIVLNACLGSIANILGSSIQSSLPLYIHGKFDEVLKTTDMATEISSLLYIRVEFQMPTRCIGGYVVFVFDTVSMIRFTENVDNFLRSIKPPDNVLAGPIGGKL
ncbi:MAG: chemotaxis protein CheC [Proteobacteria bacterium]|nr:chemotaxis protein CheC [Pseudomonadota bacterium]